MLLECCVDRTESAINAMRGGADRLELCGELIVGGITPSLSFLEQVKEAARREGKEQVKLHVLIRPRSGDFCYSEWEKQVIYEEIQRFRQAGADGVVIGGLLPDAGLDRKAMERWMEAADGMSVTLHRAFDVCRDAEEALETAISLGINTILTSGQKKSVREGMPLLKELVLKSAGRIDILAGGGVDAEAIAVLLKETGVTSFHMSGKVPVQSRMQYRRGEVPMGVSGQDEFLLWETSVEKIKEAKKAMEETDVFR